MTRRPRRPIPSSVVLAAALVAIPLLVPVGCNDAGPPPLQTLSSSGGTPTQEVVQPPSAAEKTEAMDRLDRAIKAHGGAERLRNFKICVQHMKGTMHYPDEGMVAVEQELKTQLPDRLRLWSKSFRARGIEEGVITANGNAAWYTMGGQHRPMPYAEHRDLDQELVFRRTMNLLPLKGDEFVVRTEKGEPLAGRPTVALIVGSKKMPTTRYYFDAETYLLVRTLSRAWEEANSVQEREILLSSHKSFDGLLLPTEYTDKRNGTVAITLKINYSFPKELDAKEFAQP